MILAGFSGHITNNPGIASEIANKIFRGLKFNSVIKNKKQWICEQFHKLCQDGYTNLDLPYDEYSHQFGDPEIYHQKFNVFILTNKGTQLLIDLISEVTGTKLHVLKSHDEI